MPRLIRFDAEDPYLNPLRVSAPDLIDWIERKDPEAIGAWDDLGRDEYTRAFTAARTAGYDVVDDLYFAFADTIAQGGTEVDFAKAVIPTLKAKGWLGGGGQIASRVALIYDTNLRVARGAGQWDRVQKGKAGLPYLRGVTAHDERVRHPPHSKYSDHRAFQDIVLPVDHPFWTRWWVPLGFRCRCGILQMTRSALARSGLTVTSEADLADREARLGTPIFASPGAGVIQQITKAADVENSGTRMPGLPQVDVGAERRSAAAAWAAASTIDSVTTIVRKLLGDHAGA